MHYTPVENKVSAATSSGRRGIYPAPSALISSYAVYLTGPDAVVGLMISSEIEAAAAAKRLLVL
jgi:hypothetical protein